MLCSNPFRTPVGEFGCAQCMPCRINRRRMWAARIVLESMSHVHSCFVTLTYESDPWSLVPRDWVLFMKRLRKAKKSRVRFFAVGEYGDQTFRPHYHAALFGVSLVEHELVADAWGHGYVHLGELTADSAQYIAGYVTKKMTSSDDPRLEGRCPEFARMSLRPGIGHGACMGIARNLMTLGGSAALARLGDVPGQVRIQGRMFPMGRYLRSVLREDVGRDGKTPGQVLRRWAFERSCWDLNKVKERAARRKANAATAACRAKIGDSKRRSI